MVLNEKEKRIFEDFQNSAQQFEKDTLNTESFRIELERHRDHPSVSCFLEGLSLNDFECARDYADNVTSGIILSKFTAPYNTSLQFECIVIESINRNLYLEERYPSKARPVRLILSTPGFHGNRAVAIFPENFSTKSLPKNHNSAFYFIDKFVLRFKNTTIPFLKSGKINSDCFSSILNMDEIEISKVASAWVHMHEHFHATGKLPVPEHLNIKSSRSSAALEELRVDLLTILASFAELKNERSSFFKGVLQFVLAERLLRYPLESHPNSDYDALSSIVFSTLLQQHGALEVTRNSL